MKPNRSFQPVGRAIRVLEALGRWRKVKIPFERKEWPGRIFWRNGFVEVEDWDCFLPYDWRDLGGVWQAMLPDDWWSIAVRDARKEANEARKRRLQKPSGCN